MTLEIGDDALVLRAEIAEAREACGSLSQGDISRAGIVVTKTPLRISFAGGGTDLPDFWRTEVGAVLSTTIDKYVYVTVKRHSALFNEPIRLNYALTEQVDAIGDIKNNIARECLRFMRIDPPIYISTVGDTPASSGLGGSSAFTVGLLNALHAFRGERVSAGQLAEEACHIEMNVLQEPIGKQDQYAAAFGGLNMFRFEPGGTVTVEPQHMGSRATQELFGSLMMFWTGHQRPASSVLTEQKANTNSKRELLQHMRNDAYELRKLCNVSQVDLASFGAALHANWEMKRQLGSTITNGQINVWYDRAIKAGAFGGKVCGAGGGGFLMFVVGQNSRARVREALSDLVLLPVNYESQGSSVLLSAT